MGNNDTCDGTHYENVICYFEFWPSLALAIVALVCFGVAGIIVSVVRQSVSQPFFVPFAHHQCRPLMLWCGFDGCSKTFVQHCRHTQHSMCHAPAAVSVDHMLPRHDCLSVAKPAVCSLHRSWGPATCQSPS